MSRLLATLMALLLSVGPALAEGEGIAATTKQATNPIAIGMFVAFVIITLLITYWAATRTRSAIAIAATRSSSRAFRRSGSCG